VRRYLKAMDWRWARPRLAPASLLRRKRDTETEEKLAAIAAVSAMIAQGVGHLIYLDECDLHLLPVVRAMWMKGPSVRVPTPGNNAKRAFFGALDAISGAFHWAEHGRKLAIHFVEFLQQLAATYANGPIFLVLDNVITHDAEVVRACLKGEPQGSYPLAAQVCCSRSEPHRTDLGLDEWQGCRQSALRQHQRVHQHGPPLLCRACTPSGATATTSLIAMPLFWTRA
jgi:hypothetical protein